MDNGVAFFDQPSCHHKPEVYGGIREQAAALLLRDFFALRRNEPFLIANPALPLLKLNIREGEISMNFEHNDKTKELIARVEAFMDAHIYPAESVYAEHVTGKIAKCRQFWKN